ncbi:arginase [Dongia mobilis]|uniref:Arginase n=1 Tax=Dongia mobilis TaxID=578943 RepID=A0A4R6WQI8_9PROT|nr:arginase family protein [Dongia mobilis]TDQ81520.1 arginase [Dongia mobilis]
MTSDLFLQHLPFNLLGAPIDSVGGAGGTEFSPGVLRMAADWGHVAETDRGDIGQQIRNRERDQASGLIGSRDVAEVTIELRRSVAAILHDGRRPILLGGCCTQVVGAMAGVRDAFGQAGIAYLDGHLDLYDGVTSPKGEAADMPLATLLGRGPEVWMAAAGGASVQPADVALIGPRDLEDAAGIGSLLPRDFSPALAFWQVDDVVRQGAAHVAQQACSKFAGQGIPFWLAIDVDVLDPATFSATDYLQQGGLSWADFTMLVKGLAASPGLIGLSVACYNPEKDHDHAAGRRLATLLVDALQGAAT